MHLKNIKSFSSVFRLKPHIYNYFNVPVSFVCCVTLFQCSLMTFSTFWVFLSRFCSKTGSQGTLIQSQLDSGPPVMFPWNPNV